MDFALQPRSQSLPLSPGIPHSDTRLSRFDLLISSSKNSTSTLMILLDMSGLPAMSVEKWQAAARRILQYLLQMRRPIKESNYAKDKF